MIINSPFPNPIALMIREFMFVKCGALFLIDKMPCGMVEFAGVMLFNGILVN